MDSQQIRATLLKVLEDNAGGGPGMFQQRPLLQEAAERLGWPRGEQGRALLTAWYDLFRTGHLSWGYDLDNPDPPWCHLTERGRKALEHVGRDPSNPYGYLQHLAQMRVNPIALSYIREAVQTYNNLCYKATAVMVGAAAESLVLETLDTLVARMKALSKPIPAKLHEWKIFTVTEALRHELETKTGAMPRDLREAFSSYWSAFAGQIRQVRNDTGHPTSIDPVSEASAHAALLIFPQQARLAADLISWINASYA